MPLLKGAQCSRAILPPYGNAQASDKGVICRVPSKTVFSQDRSVKGEVASRQWSWPKCPVGEALVTAAVNSMECYGRHSFQSRLKMRSVSQKQERSPGRHMQSCTPWAKKKKRRRFVLSPTDGQRSTWLLPEPRIGCNSSPVQLDGTFSSNKLKLSAPS